MHDQQHSNAINKKNVFCHNEKSLQFRAVSSTKPHIIRYQNKTEVKKAFSLPRFLSARKK